MDICETRDICEGSHLEFVASESFVSQGERRWLRWVARVERLIGHSLDGDQATDGYCLDYAYDAWADGASPEQHAAEIATAKLAL